MDWWKRGIILLLWLPLGMCFEQNTDNLVFYLDSNSDCNGPTKNVYNSRATIKGQGEIQSSGGPTFCQLTLRTERPFEVSRFKMEIGAMNIEDCNVKLSIYDGGNGQVLLDSFDCNKGAENSMRYLVSDADTVSFVLQRKDTRNTRYDIDIVVTPITAGRDPNVGIDGGDDYGYNYHRKFPTEAIIGIVGGLFIVIIIVVVILGIFCYRKQRGQTKRWEAQPLSTIRANSAYDASNISKSNMSDTSSIWASDVSRNHNYRHDYPHKSRHRPNSEYDGSEFDDENNLPPKRSYSKALSSRSGRTDRTLDTQPPGYFTATRNSYVGADDDHPQDTYVQREVPVRSRQRPRTESAKTSSVGVDPIDNEEDNAGDLEQIESEPEVEEDESQVDEDSAEEEEAQEQPLPKAVPRSQSAPTQGNAPAHIMPPAMTPVDPRLHAQMMLNPQMVMPQQYQPYHPQQQFIPVPYHQVPPGFPPPQYPGQAQIPAQTDPVQVPSVKPTDPPIYSYLVQRGYTPLDGRQSPASMSSAASHHSGARLLKEDSDSHNLDSGVEFMRR